MFYKRKNSTSFSVTSFLDNVVPTMGAYPTCFTYCANTGQDLLYGHQLSSKNVYALDKRFAFVSGICDKEGPSKNVFEKLQKYGVLDAEGVVNTMKIGPKFIHQVAVLDQRRQKQLVNLLFWWEEECQRLRKLRGEESDLCASIKEIERGPVEGEADTLPYDDQERRQLLDHLRFEREKVRMRIRQRPSERRADVEAGTDDLSRHVHGRTLSVPDMHEHQVPLTLSRTVDAASMKPPAYRP